MAESRENRMAARLRGAARHQVEDVSFGFVLPSTSPAPEASTSAAPAAQTSPPQPPPPPPPAAAPRSANPNTSAKRRRIAADDNVNTEPTAAPGRARTPMAPPPLPPTTRSGTRSGGRLNEPDTVRPQPSAGPTRPSPKSATSALRRSIARSTPSAPAGDDEDELESLPRPTPVSDRPARRTPRPPQPAEMAEEMVEIVSESPAHAPGSGRRSRVSRVSEIAAGSGTALQRAVLAERRLDEEDEITGEVEMSFLGGGVAVGVASSPLVRKAERNRSRRVAGAADEGFGKRGVRGRDVRRGEVDELSPAPGRVEKRSAAKMRTARLSRESGDGEVDELSPAPLRVDGRNALRTRSVTGRNLGMDEVDELSPAPGRVDRRSATKMRTARLSRESGDGEVDELSPDKGGVSVAAPSSAKKKLQAEAAKLKPKLDKPSTSKTQAAKPVKPESPIPAQNNQRTKKPKGRPANVRQVEGPEEPEEAEEIDENEAARRLGRKRPRRSISSPLVEAEEESDIVAEEAAPAAKRRRKEKALQSPVAQQRPKTRKEKKQAEQTKKPPATKKKGKTGTKAPVDEDEDELQGGTIPVIVQRFTKKVRIDADDGAADVLSSDLIPFANRGGVNVVDVLAQMCDEMVDSFLSKLYGQTREAADPAVKREYRTMIRALDLFREQLSTRLLGHTIALDDLHALQKRVRVAQRDKLALREEILKIRAEREQLALRMDAVRIKHEERSKEALQNISFSSTMHDIDLAVERGMAAPPLSSEEQSKPELANLEYLISKVTEQACAESDQGGTLKQIKDFNAFLERAAVALEMKGAH